MKNLSISLALISMLATSQSSFAELSETPSNPSPTIEKVVVVSTPEVANFEIYSEKLGALAIKNVMTLVTESFDNEDKNQENSAEI